MTLCKKCGVELEDGMTTCPLCRTPISGDAADKTILWAENTISKTDIHKQHLLRRILWQITSVLLLSGVLATLIINLSIQGDVTWSVYPMSICMIIFSYASIMALWHTKIIIQILAGWLASALILIALNLLFPDVNWPIHLALPILSAMNVIGISLIIFLAWIKTKGFNVLAIIFVALAAACLIVDGIISFYFDGKVRLRWSVIVAACLLPVVAALFFMFFRTKNNPDLHKIFHT